MLRYLLHEGATVICAHAGQAQPTSANHRIKVNGYPIVTQQTLYTIAGCVLPPPPQANGPCANAQWITAATRVKASGVPVLLQDSQAICSPSGTGLIVAITQLKVKGV
jgi:hypothetical protein